MGLEIYQQKRDFTQTPEPEGEISETGLQRFVCQEHHASNLHFDFRLEIGGVLKSWSIRKGPSMNPELKRLAIPTEDHPVEYLEFQGRIPAGNYGAGEHLIWDSGTFELVDGEDAKTQFDLGKLKFELNGERLKGFFNLFRLSTRNGWLLVKAIDTYADESWKLELLTPDKAGSLFIEEEKKSVRRKTHKPIVKRGLDEGVVKTNAKPEAGEELPDIAQVLKAENHEGTERVRVGEYALELTNLDKVYWTEEGYTKADLLRYYFQISEYILPHLENRPLIMRRYPTGVTGQSFHQHNVEQVPEYVRTIAVIAEDKGEHTVNYIVGGNLETHLYMANLGAIERHPWLTSIEKLDFPDWFVFDLDPGDEVPFETICEVALSTREIIARLGLESYAKTSGSRGIHVYVPIRAEYHFERVTALAESIAQIIAHEHTEIATTERSKQKRLNNQIYIDFMQNTYGKSVVAPYSVRPAPGATVSAPLTWEEIEEKNVAIGDFTIMNMVERVRTKGELFKGVLTNRQSLEEAFEKIKGKAKEAA